MSSKAKSTRTQKKWKVRLDLRILHTYNKTCCNLQPFPDAIRDIRETAEEYGRIMSMTAKSGHAYIEFQEASVCQEAYAALRGKTFDDKIVFALFYPISLWNQKIYI